MSTSTPYAPRNPWSAMTGDRLSTFAVQHRNFPKGVLYAA
jgi:hypothetical protein